MGWITFEIRTQRRAQLIDLTDKVDREVARSDVSRSVVSEGVCQVYVQHTTAGGTINEGADPDVARDIETFLAMMVPKESGFRHGEGNSDSHIKTILVGPSVTAPVRGGRLALGTWQAIFLCEWDGPRTRTAEVAGTPP